MRAARMLERARSEACLSDLRLDRWMAGELDADAGAALKAHLNGCEACRARAAELQREAIQVLPRATGPSCLYLQLFWGDALTEAQAYRGDVRASDSAVPLWGFEVPESFVLARADRDGYRLSVPPGARLAGVPAGEVFLKRGESIRMEGRTTTLVAHVDAAPEVNAGRALRLSRRASTAAVLLCAAAASAFIAVLPRRVPQLELSSHEVSPVAIRLIAAEPHRREEAQRSVERIAAQAELALPREERRRVQKPPAPKALSALARLSASGGATRDILARIEKRGAGAHGGFSLQGVLGGQPLPSVTLGSYGIGPSGTRIAGGELLHGAGAGGIGAMGLGDVGRAAVGGVVQRASARAVESPAVDREAIARVVNEHLKEVYACYEAALLEHPKLEGRETVAWQVRPDGRVQHARIASTTMPPSTLESCLLASLGAWTFPKFAPATVNVSYPFVFNPVPF
jgi:hypothetical protein